MNVLDKTFKIVYIPERKITVHELLLVFREQQIEIQSKLSKRAQFTMIIYIKL